MASELLAESGGDGKPSGPMLAQRMRVRRFDPRRRACLRDYACLRD
jgi:hypothetical protein